MSQIKHNSGLSEQVSEIGFDTVKFFSGPITTTAYTLSIEPPARRIIVRNASQTNDLFVRINNGAATATESLVPGNNIKICALCVFTMDFDTINEVSLVAGSGTVEVECLLGWKGVVC